jgi:hypothetical protein
LLLAEPDYRVEQAIHNVFLMTCRRIRECIINIGGELPLPCDVSSFKKGPKSEVDSVSSEDVATPPESSDTPSFTDEGLSFPWQDSTANSPSASCDEPPPVRNPSKNMHKNPI